MQACLPVRWGGLEIRSAVALAPCAFLASIFASQALVQQILPICFQRGDDSLIAGAIGCWQRLGGAQPPAHPSSHSQRNWDNPICEATFASILSSSDAVGRARLLASTSNGSGQWLHALPSSSLGLRLTDEETRIAVGLRIGADLVFPHKCICRSQVLSNGHHGLSCKKSSGRFLRHSLANDIIARSFRSADTPVTLEPTGMLRSDGKRPDGVTMIPWSRGRTLVWDFTCPDTVAPSRVHQTSLATGVAASDAESKKSAKYSELKRNHIFVPFAVETLGAWGASAWSLSSEIGARLSRKTGDPRATAFLRQNIDVAIQRGNAASILGTLH